MCLGFYNKKKGDSSAEEPALQILRNSYFVSLDNDPQKGTNEQWVKSGV